MQDDQNEWAKAENPEVEQAKDAFAEAQEANQLRTAFHEAATAAVKYGHVDRDWVNNRLAHLGIEPVTGTAQYRINTPIVGNYGTTVTATSRVEALEKFQQYTAGVAAAGEVRGGSHGAGVFGVEFTGGAVTFFSGPQDPEPYDGPVPDLAGLKAGIRDMLKDGVTGFGWGHCYAQDTVAALNLEPLPALQYRTVNVPVSGVTQVTVTAFDGDDDDTVVQSAKQVVSRGATATIVPDEVGDAFLPRAAGGMGLTLVDDDED